MNSSCWHPWEIKSLQLSPPRDCLNADEQLLALGRVSRIKSCCCLLATLTRKASSGSGAAKGCISLFLPSILQYLNWKGHIINAAVDVAKKVTLIGSWDHPIFWDGTWAVLCRGHFGELDDNFFTSGSRVIFGELRNQELTIFSENNWVCQSLHYQASDTTELFVKVMLDLWDNISTCLQGKQAFCREISLKNGLLLLLFSRDMSFSDARWVLGW